MQQSRCLSSVFRLVSALVLSQQPNQVLANPSPEVREVIFNLFLNGSIEEQKRWSVRAQPMSRRRRSRTTSRSYLKVRKLEVLRVF
mmetsp:Transcript_26417/g.41293  ORF Transcript_26417/g.41293 Transcript_26417/m.41293 type:complete len:86 (+) Transcript_26417:70-327(+)